MEQQWWWAAGAAGGARAVVSCRSTDGAAAAAVSCRWSCSGDELQGVAAMVCCRGLREEELAAVNWDSSKGGRCSEELPVVAAAASAGELQMAAAATSERKAAGSAVNK